MEIELFQSIQAFFNEKWVKRFATLSAFLAKVEQFPTIAKLPKIVDITKKSVVVKNFVDIMQDASGFNITKMNETGKLYKVLSVNKHIKNFLVQNNKSIETVLKKIAQFKKANPFFEKMQNTFKITGKLLFFVDIGMKYYGNYKETKHVWKALAGTFVDTVADFNPIDGFVIGSQFGEKGAIAGIVVGSIIQITNFFNPDLKDYAKKKVYDLFPKEKTTVNEFAVSKDVLEARIQFYQKVIEKLIVVKDTLQRFINHYDVYAKGKTATMTKQQLQQLKEKVDYIRETYIEQTYQHLKQHLQKSNTILKQVSELNQFYQPFVYIEKNMLYHNIQSLEEVIIQYQRLALASVDKQWELQQMYKQFVVEKQKLVKLSNLIEEMETMKLYDI